jgi:3-hydroxyacyl-CoA dehydrogenase
MTGRVEGETVRTRSDGALFVIEIDDSLTPATIARLAVAIDEFARGPGTAAVLCGRHAFPGDADGEAPAPELSALVANLADRIESLDRPVVAALSGTVLGSGVELALAAHGRIADPGARLGLPGVRLGRIAAAGGTQRLPRLVGATRALDWLVSGELIDAATARAAGLIDEVAAGDLAGAAAAFARQLVGRILRTRDRTVPEEAAGGAEALQRRAAQRARGAHAPMRIAQAVAAAIEWPFEAGTARERELAAECRSDPQSAALEYLARAERTSAMLDGGSTVASVAVLGAGTMGAGIAIACLEAGLSVTLIDVDAASLSRGAARVRSTLESAVGKKRSTPAQCAARQARLTCAGRLEFANSSDLIIEAVFENLELKRQVFAELDAVAKSGALLATNTSYLDVDRIAAATGRAESVLGLHFFSPANVMRLLEVVRGARTGAAALASGVAFARALGKIPVIAGNRTGFIGNRMLQAYGRESQLLLLEGASPAQVDGALERFGMAMGPCAVFDLAGIDVGYRARRERNDLPDDPRYFRVADLLVEAGRLGQKTGQGHYRYAAREREPDPEVERLIAAEAARLGISRRTVTDEEIVERCMDSLINEGARLLDESVAGRAADIDVVWANGYGFPRWRGGPMYYADGLGLARVHAAVVARARGPDARYWQSADCLARLAQSGGRFAQTGASGQSEPRGR